MYIYVLIIKCGISLIDRNINAHGTYNGATMMNTSLTNDYNIMSLPSPAWAEGTVLSLCVCVCAYLSVLPQNCCKLQLSKNLNKLQVTNLVIRDKKWFSTRQASFCRQAWLE